jgi:hypothetical protein
VSPSFLNIPRIYIPFTHIGVWLFDLAPRIPSSISLTGIDVQSDLWSPPPSLISNHPNVSFRLNSVLSLPREWTSTFTLINQRLLISGLKRSEWPIAISEIYRVTKPGGWVQLTECGSFGPVEGGGKSARLEEAVRKWYDKAGLWWDIGKNLPSLLQEAGFEDVRVIERDLPLGHRPRPSEPEVTVSHGKWSSDLSQIVRQGTEDVMLKIIKSFIDRGIIEPEEKEEAMTMWEDVLEEWDCMECSNGMNTVIARKPIF